MTRPRYGCGSASFEQVILKTGSSLDSAHVAGSVHVGKFVVPTSTHPAERSWPLICALWQVAQVRFNGLPKPMELMCAASRSQNWRYIKMSAPRATEER